MGTVPHGGTTCHEIAEPGFAKFRLSRAWLFVYCLAHERAGRYRDAQHAEVVFRLFMALGYDLIARALCAAVDRERGA